MDCSSGPQAAQLPWTSWVYIYRPSDDIIHDVLTLAVPKPKRTFARRLLKGTVMVANVAFWLKGFL